MKDRVLFVLLMWGFWISPLVAQGVPDEGQHTREKSEKERPPRIPDGPFVPKKGMFSREKGEFWAGPQDQGRFIQIMTLALLPQDQLNAKLQEWPMYQEFSEDQKTRLVERVGEFRIQSRKEALKVAKDFHLSVTSENEDAFVRDYWSERVATEKAIREQLSPMKKKLEGEAKQRLEKQYKPKEAK